MEQYLKELQQIPGVGKIIAKDLYNLGFHTISDLKNKDPELLYDMHNSYKGSIQDICMLYTFKCAVYYANTVGKTQDPEKLRWWYWKGGKEINKSIF